MSPGKSSVSVMGQNITQLNSYTIRKKRNITTSGNKKGPSICFVKSTILKAKVSCLWDFYLRLKDITALLSFIQKDYKFCDLVLIVLRHILQ